MKLTTCALALAALPFAALPGCADDQPPPRAPTNAPEPVRGKIYVQPLNGAMAVKLADKLSAALARTGYHVVSSGDDAHDVSADLMVTLRETKSVLQVYVNGQLKKSFVAEATLHVKGGGRLLGAESVQYDAADGPTDENLQSLVAAATSTMVRRYLVELRNRRQGEVSKQRQQEEDETDARAEKQVAEHQEKRRREEAAWNQIVLSECSAATQLTGCDGVKQYLAEYPTGRHAADARKALEAGTPLIVKLGDERDWRVAKPEVCKSPKASTDCDGVTSYIEAQPAGAHVKEARALLAESQPKLAAARKAEERREQEEEAKNDRESKKQEADEKRQAREECKKDCLRNICFTVRPGVFDICMSRCVKANCE